MLEAIGATEITVPSFPDEDPMEPKEGVFLLEVGAEEQSRCRRRCCLVECNYLA